MATDYLPVCHEIWGGGEQACLRMSRMLIKNGHDLTVLSTKPDRTPDKDLNLQRVRVIEDFFPKRLKYLIRQIKSAFCPIDVVALFSAYSKLRRIKPEVLHLHNVHSLSFSMMIAAKLLNIRVIISIYDYGIICPIGFLWKLSKFNDYEGTNCTKFHGIHCTSCITKQKTAMRPLALALIVPLWFRKKILDSLLKKVDGFIVLSHSNAEVLIDYGIEESIIGVVQIPMEENSDIEEIEKDTILFVGWLHPRKGPHVVVRAMPYILEKKPNARLYMFGDHKGNKAYKVSIQKYIKDNNLEDRVCLFGRKPHNEVQEYFKKANVIVIPETWETIAPNTLTEGLTFGKAIVASSMGGSRDYIIDGENGLLAGNNDSIEFSNKILSILSSDDLQTRLSRNAKNSSRELFSENKVNTRLINYYRMILDGSNSHEKLD